MRIAFVVAGAFAAVVAIAGIPLYVLPALDEPSSTDVVYVIGPPTEARLDVAREFVEDGLTGAVMISLDPDESERWEAAAAVCDGAWQDDPATADAEVICAKPEPFTTRGEARELEREMAAHGWESAAVVTIRPHVSRARMIIERCEVGELSMVDSGESLHPWYWAYHYAYQSAGFVKAGVLSGC
ncbi:ElyC/SanA/YdcF family protein [Demequina sp. NBRC 110056]|uniref:ElyC/SanA/YdcF family protein n=1 Tax=Demequina sp. NBRC 110056 TaxID=1570345 RepID=UPI000A06D2CA|nr:ElyC/SanA/YdcF family protein [Demequina sp. NBRC 110056]